jgi:hypothetical protein
MPKLISTYLELSHKRLDRLQENIRARVCDRLLIQYLRDLAE